MNRTSQSTPVVRNYKWKKKYHTGLLSFVESGKPYQTINKYDDPQFEKNNKSMLKYAKLLNNVGGIEFSEYQLDLTNGVIPFITKQMYDEYWLIHKPTIMKLFSTPLHIIKRHQILSTTARREGKTSFYRNQIIAIVLSCLVDHGMELRIAIPAHREKTSREAMFKLKQALFQVPEFSEFIIEEENVDVLRFRRPNSAGFIEIHAFAGDEVSFVEWVVGCGWMDGLEFC